MWDVLQQLNEYLTIPINQKEASKGLP